MDPCFMHFYIIYRLASGTQLIILWILDVSPAQIVFLPQKIDSVYYSLTHKIYI